jgi:uncharacterized OB-fold protein
VRPTEVSGRGVIELLTFLHQGPRRDGVDYSGGYPVAAVGLVEQPGLRIAASVAGERGAIHLGAEVRLDWREVDGRPIPLFRLLDATSTAPVSESGSESGSGSGSGSTSDGPR